MNLLSEVFEAKGTIQPNGLSGWLRFARGAGPADANLVFRRWSREPPYRVQVIDDHGRLPRDDGSWR